MAKYRVNLGQKGEEIAKEHLIKDGYIILQKNFKFKNGEIDLIAKKDETLVFVEVKSRTNLQYGLPEFSITSKKRAAIYRTAEYYLFKNNIENFDCRVDVITILFDNNNGFKLNHFENI